MARDDKAFIGNCEDCKKEKKSSVATPAIATAGNIPEMAGIPCRRRHTAQIKRTRRPPNTSQKKTKNIIRFWGFLGGITI